MPYTRMLLSLAPHSRSLCCRYLSVISALHRTLTLAHGGPWSVPITRQREKLRHKPANRVELQQPASAVPQALAARALTPWLGAPGFGVGDDTRDRRMKSGSSILSSISYFFKHVECTNGFKASALQRLCFNIFL